MKILRGCKARLYSLKRDRWPPLHKTIREFGRSALVASLTGCQRRDNSTIHNSAPPMATSSYGKWRDTNTITLAVRKWPAPRLKKSASRLLTNHRSIGDSKQTRLAEVCRDVARADWSRVSDRQKNILLLTEFCLRWHRPSLLLQDVKHSEQEKYYIETKQHLISYAHDGKDIRG